MARIQNKFFLAKNLLHKSICRIRIGCIVYEKLTDGVLISIVCLKDANLYLPILYYYCLWDSNIKFFSFFVIYHNVYIYIYMIVPHNSSIVLLYSVIDKEDWLSYSYHIWSTYYTFILAYLCERNLSIYLGIHSSNTIYLFVNKVVQK